MPPKSIRIGTGSGSAVLDDELEVENDEDQQLEAQTATGDQEPETPDENATRLEERRIKILDAQNTVESETQEYLNEVEPQIDSLCNQIGQEESQFAQQVPAKLHIELGKLLNKVEEIVQKKSHYTAWLKKYKLKTRFGERHIRYFQTAKQLAKMGDFAQDNAHLGKYRLLEVDQLLNKKFKEKYKGKDKEKIKGEEKKAEKIKILNGILDNDNNEDVIKRRNGENLNPQFVDVKITLHRFRDAGIHVIDLKKALEMVEFEYGSVKVGTVKKIKNWLDSINEDEKKDALTKYISDGMRFPSDWKPSTEKKNPVDLVEKIRHSVEGKRQKKLITKEAITDAREYLTSLEKKMEADSKKGNDPPKESDEKKTE